MIIEVSRDGKDWAKAFEFRGDGILDGSEFWILSLYRYVRFIDEEERGGKE